MDLETIAAQRPRDIDEALSCMRTALEFFHERSDNRAIFLRLYYIMTLEVHAAVNQLGDYQRQIFLDPAWIGQLSGHFASLYFRSLSTFKRAPDLERAWKIAHDPDVRETSTVVQNALLGINAHINYDLPYALFLNLEGSDKSHLALQRRKFDHDQVNNLLIRTIDYIQSVLARDYGEGIEIVDRTLGQLDERISADRLGYYRERVWWDAMSFVSTSNEDQQEIVRDKLNWESYKVAKFLISNSLRHLGLWMPERLLGIRALLCGKKCFKGIVLETEGGVAVGEKAIHPHR